MATVKQIILGFVSSPAKRTKEEVKEIVDSFVHDENTKKLNHVDRLKRLCKEAKTISFLAVTPGTTHDRNVHAVMLQDAMVEKTKEGNYIIKGRDLEEELKLDLKNEIPAEELSIMRKREKCVVRSYRIDRIIRGSINWN